MRIDEIDHFVRISCGTSRCLEEVVRLRTLVRMYLRMTRGSCQRPSARSACDGTLCFERSVAHPARARAVRSDA